METKYIIGIVVAIGLLILLLAAGLGIAAYMKGSFSDIKFMAGDSEFEKLIRKINDYLKR